MKIKINDQYSKFFIISEKMINDFAEITGDKNPIHIDEEFAKNTIFKKRISQGLLVGSFISSVLGNDFPGIGTIYLAQNLKFLNPVFIDDKIKVRVEVIEITKNNWLKLKTECTNQLDKVVISGEATVIPPTNCELVW